MDFGNFKLEKAAQEVLAGARHCDFWVVVLVVDIFNHRTHCFTLTEEITGYAFALGQKKFDFVIVKEEGFAAPCLVNLAGDNLALEFRELIIDGFFLEVEDFALEGLAQVEDCAASEVSKNNLACMLVANLRVRVLVGTGVGEAYLEVRIGHLSVRHNFKVLENLHVTLVRVHNHVKIFICAEHFCKHVAKRFFEHAYHSCLVDILQFLELGKTLHHIRCFFFLSHLSMGMVLNYLKSM